MNNFFKHVFFTRPGSIKAPGGLIETHTELLAELFDDKGKKLDERRVKDRVLTTAFVNDIVDALQGMTNPYAWFDDYKHHWSGTSTEAEAASDTNLFVGTTEDRVAGTQTTSTSSNIYKSVATITYDSTHSITEHGLFNSTSSTSGTLMDRTKFTALNVLNGYSIQFTFTVEFTAGG